MLFLLKSQNSKISLDLSEDMALFIASHVVSNVRDLEGALLKLKAFVDFSKIDHSFITKDVIEGALGDLIKPTKSKLVFIFGEQEVKIKNRINKILKLLIEFYQFFEIKCNDLLLF